jgi:hypothetical protein
VSVGSEQQSCSDVLLPAGFLTPSTVTHGGVCVLLNAVVIHLSGCCRAVKLGATMPGQLPAAAATVTPDNSSSNSSSSWCPEAGLSRGVGIVRQHSSGARLWGLSGAQQHLLRPPAAAGGAHLLHEEPVCCCSL